ncbi:hypothetical protein SHIRM173S_05278 [Streptomyces hirsutus]
MSSRTLSDLAPVLPARPHGWARRPSVTVLGGLVGMGLVAALGTVPRPGATDLPDGSSFPSGCSPLTVVTAVGGSVDLSGDASGLAGAEGGLTVMPLSVTLTGALFIGWSFLRPLRHRAVAGAPDHDLLGRRVLTEDGEERGTACSTRRSTRSPPVSRRS